MTTYAEFLAAQKKQEQEKAAASASIVVGATDTSPDQVAGDMRLAQDYAKETGKPQPPLPMVTENRSVFQQEIDKTRTGKVLAGNPALADWLRRPENAAIANDSVDELSFFEQYVLKPLSVTSEAVAMDNPASRAFTRGAARLLSIPQIGTGQDQAEVARDVGKTEEQIKAEIIAEMGPTDDMVMLNAAGDQARMRFERIQNMDDGDKVVAVERSTEAFQTARDIIDRASSIAMSDAATRFRDEGLAGSENSVSGFFSAVANDPTGAVSFVLETAAESLPILGVSAAATTLGGPGAGAAVMGGSSMAVENSLEVDGFLREKGLDLTTPDAASAILLNPEIMREAKSRGMTRGLIIGVLDGLSGGLAGQTLSKSPVGNMLLQGLTQAAFGSGGEALAQAANGDELQWADILIEGLAEFATAPVEVIGVGGQMFQDRAAKAEAARQDQARLAEFVGAAAASKVRERAPDAFRDYIARTTAGKGAETMYVPADAFDEYFQSSGMSPDEVIAQLDGVDPNQVAEARATGGDIAIPTATFAAKIAGSEHDKFLLQNSRFNPEDMTFAEAETWEAEKAVLLEQAMSQVEEMKAQAAVEIEAGQAVFDTMVQRITAAGWDVQKAKNEALLYRKFYETRAARSGQTVSSLLERYPLPEMRGAAQQPQAAGVAVGAPKVKEPGDFDTEIRKAGVNADGESYLSLANPELFDLLKTASSPLGIERDNAISTIQRAIAIGRDDIAQAVVAKMQRQADRAAAAVPGVDPDSPRYEGIKASLAERAAIEAQDAAEARALLGGLSTPDAGLYDQDGTVVTYSEPFKQWFGASKVVDDAGAPRVMYHGTLSEFDQFTTDVPRRQWDAAGAEGFFFTSAPDRADVYAGTGARVGGKPYVVPGGNVVPAYVSLQNPKIVTLNEDGSGPQFGEELVDGNDGAYLRSVKEEGYDGLIVKSKGEDFVVAFDPTQIKSVFNRGTFDRSSPNILEQGGVPLFDSPLPIQGKVTVKAIGEAMTQDHLDRHGRQYFPETSEEDYRAVLGWMGEEITSQLAHPNSGVGWYSKDVQLAMELAAKAYPTLASNATHRDLFLTFAGLFSNGAEPEGAFMNAAEAFETFMATGKIPVNRASAAVARGQEPKQTSFKNPRTGEQINQASGWGIRNAANEQQLQFIKTLVEREGSVDAAIAWLRTPQPRTEINRAMTETGLYKAGRYTTKKEIAGPDAYGIMAFGEKLGRYTMGLHGVEIDAGDTTIDLWYSRTYRRLTGRLLETPVGADGVVSGPTDRDRKVIFRLTGDLVQQFDLPAGDVQAVLWFWEKRLWGAQGLRTNEGTNSSGARKLLRSKGLNDGTGGDGSGDGAGLNAESREYAQSGYGDRAGRYSGGGLTPLPGAPIVAGASGPDQNLVAVAEEYARANGIDLKRQATFVDVDPARAFRIASAYEAMPHAPNDPMVREAYAALIEQTTDQYRALEAAGYKFWFMDPEADPYGGNPWSAMRDLRANKSMAVFPTEAGFGSGAQVNIGLANPKGGADLKPEDVLAALKEVGAEVEASSLFTSDSEPTLVIKINGVLSQEQGDRLSEMLGQEAIAQRTDDEKGQLFGPMAEKWGPYNPDLFITSTGARANEIANPLLAETGIEWGLGSPEGPKRPVTANDLFRAVHDAFGHGLEGAGFRARGEENAWQAHVRLFYGPAVAAITSETRGQNSWLNYGPHGESNRTASVFDTVFAEQKTGIMPDWTWLEGRALDEAPTTDGRGMRYIEPRPQLPIRADGKVELTHWSNSRRRTLDPTKAGSGPLVGPDYRSGAEMTFYGIDAASSREAQKNPIGYVKESGLGPWRHVVAVDPARLYPWFEDPMGFKERFRREEGMRASVSDYQEMIREAGYLGYYTTEDGSGSAVHGLAAAVFEPLKAERIVDERTAADMPIRKPSVKRPSTLKDFVVNRGGIWKGDDRGDIAALEYRRPGFLKAKKLERSTAGNNGGGLTLDDMREAAVEAGYLPDGSDINALIDALDGDIRGNRVIAQADMNAEAEWTAFENRGQTPGEMDAPAPAETVDRSLFEDADGTSYFQSPSLVRVDNPGGAWLAEKQQYAEEVMAQQHSVLRSSRAKGLVGPSTAFTTTPVFLPTELLASLPGASGENRVPGDPKFDQLDRLVQNYGFKEDQDGNAVLVGVNHLGQAFLIEGNTRTAVAASRGIKRIRAEVRWFNGGETADGPITPQIIEEQGTPAPTSKGYGNTLFQEKRGSIQFHGGPGVGQAVINTFKDADLSTVLHESGHLFLTILQAEAARGEPSAVAEFDTLKDWWVTNAGDVAKDASATGRATVTADDVERAVILGSTGDKAKDTAIDVGMQEQFARGFEAYLMSGEAPSTEVRTAFASFREWLKSVYRSLASLNVKATPEVKAVFDRMIATDEEIAKAKEREAGQASLFMSAGDMGLPEADFAKYLKLAQEAQDEATAKLTAEVMAPIRRQTEKWFREEKAKLVEKLTAEKRALPIYRAIQEMRFGVTFEGDATPNIKLNRKVIEQRHGENVLALLPGAPKTGKGHRWAVYASGDGGMHPDVVAEMYGFKTGLELIGALLNTPSLEEAVETEAEALLTQKHGDVLKDGRIEQAAMDALKSDKKALLIARELGALNARLQADPTLKRSLLYPKISHYREMARRTLERMPVNDARATVRYVSASRKAADEAFRALAKGDIRTAAEAKRRHLLAHMMYMEARKIDAEVNKLVTKIGKLNRADSKIAKGVNVDYAKAARAVAAKFGLANADAGFDVDMWLEQLSQDDPATHAALAHAIQTYTQNAKPFKALTVGEFRAVADAVANLVSLGRTARTVEIEGETLSRDQVVADLAAVLDQRGIKSNPALKAKLSASQKMGKAALSMLSALRRVENWARDMDDGKQGPYTRYLVRPVMDAIGTYRDAKAKRLAELLAILQQIRKDALGSGAISAPELDYTFENKAEVLHAILHTGNESNKEKLLIGRGWSQGLTNQKQKVTPSGKMSVDRNGNPILDRGTVDTTKWDTFIARMIKEGTITKADYDAVQAIWDLMEDLKRPAQAAHRKMFGFYFQEIEASPVSTPFGSYRGGYVPAIADQDASNDGQIRADQAALETQQTSFMFPTTGNGFTKSRVQEYRTPLALDLMLLPAHMDKVLRFTHLEPAIRQTAGIISNRDMREAMDAYDPSLIASMLTPWLQRTAQQAVEARATTPAGRAFSNIARELRRRVGLHTMFMNVVNTAQQITGFSTAMVLVKPGRMSAALSRYVAGGAPAMRAEAMAQSAFMRERVGNAARETQGRIQEAVVKPTIPGELRALVDKHGYVLQQITQNVMDVIIWHAAFDQAIAKGATDADAIFEADSVIRRTIGDFGPENISLFETGNAFTRLFTMFYSYFNGQANLVGGEMKTAMRTAGWNGTPRMFWVYLMGIAAPAIVAELIVQGFRGDLGDDDDDGYADEIAATVLGAQGRYITAMVPVAGQLTMALLNRFNNQVYDDRLSTSPVVSAVERAVGAPASIGSATLGKGKPKPAVLDGLTALGLITGIPMGQLAKMAGYGTDVATGKAKPKGVGDLMQGLASGRDGTQ